MDIVSEAKTLPEFDGHVDVIEFDDPTASLHGFVAIHRGGKQKPAFGATRIWSYKTPQEALRDAIKLSRIMSYKSALAGLSYGGAKAVLIAPSSPIDRNAFITAYATFLNSIPNRIITGADVGVSLADVDKLATLCKSIVGTKVDAVKYTVNGLLVSMRIALLKRFDSEDMTERTFAIQGLGKVGFGLLENLAAFAKQIYVSDVNPDRIREAQNLGSRIIPIGIDDIYTQNADVFAPCALSNTINQKTVSLLKCAIVLGSANVQLESDTIGDTLFEHGIMYAPDYIVNAGGLISVVSEYEHGKEDIPDIRKKIITIGTTLNAILDKSSQTHTPPHRVANEMAKKISDQFT